MLRAGWACLVLIATTPAWADDLVDHLRQESRAAFARGLLPVADFLDQQSGGVLLRLRQMTSNDERSVVAALQPRIIELRQAVAAMEQFNQPAAAEWASDLALLRYTLTQAEFEVAAVSGQTSATKALLKAESNWAWEHYRRRAFDEQVLGHASLPQLLDAAARLNLTPTVERSLRRDVLAKTKHWSAAGAGIGRQDRVLAAEFDVVHFGTRPTEERPTEQEMQAFAEADRLGKQLFDSDVAYYRNGTASLADMARAWRLRQRLHEEAEDRRIMLPFATTPALKADLATLTNLADSTTDRRGRIASDVLYVHVIQELQTTREAARAAMPVERR